jgi:ABC-type sugar transport system, ATPase component
MKQEILRLEHVNKRVSNFNILDDFKLNIYRGELVSLVGLQGCGKEELGTILSGSGGIDEGTVYFEEEPFTMQHMFSAEKLGIFSLFENSVLIPHLTVAENIFIIWKNSLLRFIVNKKKAEMQAALLLNFFGLSIDPGQKGEDLSAFEQQMVKIVKAYAKGAKLVIANDIAGIYSSNEFKILRRALERLKQDGISVLWITSKLDLVTADSDRVIIMRNGKSIRTFFNPDINHMIFLKAYLEDEHSAVLTRTTDPSQEVLFEMNGLYSDHLQDIRFKVHKSEILGILDVRSSGKKELEKILTGEKKPISGSMLLGNKKYNPSSLKDAIRSGVGYIGENVIENSLVPSIKVIDNIMLPLLGRPGLRSLFVNRKLQNFVERNCIEKFHFESNDLKIELLAELMGRDSGDVFLHRVLYARWYFSYMKMLVCVEPFSRLDVSKRSQIIDIIDEILKNNVGMIILSINIQDLLSVCDRILVLKDSRVLHEYRKDSFNEIDLDNLYL